MEILKEMRSGTLYAKLVGKFTFSDHLVFREILDSLPEQEVKSVVFNMEKLDYVDSAALGMMLLALDTAEKNQKSLAINSATGQVKKMFELARFHTLFAMN